MSFVDVLPDWLAEDIVCLVPRIEKALVIVEEKSYHKSCFKCSHGGCGLSPSSYTTLDGDLYCKHHFSQLFKEKGSYDYMIKCASVKREEAQSHKQHRTDKRGKNSEVCNMRTIICILLQFKIF